MAEDTLAAWLTQVWDEQEKLATDCVAEVGTHRAGDPFPDGSGDADYDAFPSYPWGSSGWELSFMADPGHPASVLARIAADRQILAMHTTLDGQCEACVVDPRVEYGGLVFGLHESYCPTVRLLAQPYSNRPGYQEEWKP